MIIKRGRNKGKWMLSERFQEAIDSAAMKCGKAGTDDYVAEWRRTTTAIEASEDIQAQAKAEAINWKLTSLKNVLKLLIAAGGLDSN